MKVKNSKHKSTRNVRNKQEQINRFWNTNTVKNEDGQTEGHLYLYGDISTESWWGDEVTPERFREDIEALGEISTLNVHIFSNGGDVFAGFAIYGIIKQHKAVKNIYIEGIAASIATIIALAGDNIYISKVGMVMIHWPMAILWGFYNILDLSGIKSDLEKIAEPMIAAYTARTNLEQQEVIDYLDAENGKGTWFTASEAIEAGLADEYIPQEVEEELDAVACIGPNVYEFKDKVFDLSEYENIPFFQNERRKEMKGSEKSPAVKNAVKATVVKAEETENATYDIVCPECEAEFQVEADADATTINVTCPECDANFDWNVETDEEAKAAENPEDDEEEKEEGAEASYQQGMKAERQRMSDLDLLAKANPEQVSIVSEAKEKGWSYQVASKRVMKAKVDAEQDQAQKQTSKGKAFLDQQKQELAASNEVSSASKPETQEISSAAAAIINNFKK